MRKWVLIGIAAVGAAGLLVYILLSKQDASKRASTSASPTPSVTQTNSSGPTPNASPSLTPSTAESKGNNKKVTQGPTPTAPPAQSLEGPVLVAGGQRAASNLESEVGCRDDAPGKGFADLKWTPAHQRGLEQKLQVTIYKEGFESGNFQVSEALTPDRASYRWSRPEGQAIHYWRVLTRHSDGWVPSETAKFEGPSCVGV